METLWAYGATSLVVTLSTPEQISAAAAALKQHTPIMVTTPEGNGAFALVVELWQYSGAGAQIRLAVFQEEHRV